MEKGQRARDANNRDEFENIGRETSFLLTSMGNLTLIYRNQRWWKEAKELNVQIMKTSLRVLGEEHSSTLTSMANLVHT